MVNNKSDSQGGQTIHSDDESSKLSELVTQHKVCWEIWPEYHIGQDGKKVQIGFELDLSGTHYHPEHSPLPGCAECMKVYKDLKRIAEGIIPKEERYSRYRIGVFDSSIHNSPRRGLRKDIELVIKILHREGFDQPVDACQTECLNEMEKRLKELGAQKERWREPSQK